MKYLSTISLLITIPLLALTLQFTVFAEDSTPEEQRRGEIAQSKKPQSPDSICHNFRLAGIVYKDLNDSGTYEEGKDEILSGQPDLITREGVTVPYGPYTFSSNQDGTYALINLQGGTYNITGSNLKGGWIADSQELIVECPESNYEHKVDIRYHLRNTGSSEIYDFSEYPMSIPHFTQQLVWLW